MVAIEASNLRPARAQLAEPPDADPHVGWCGRGEQVTAPPIPIGTANPTRPAPCRLKIPTLSEGAVSLRGCTSSLDCVVAGFNPGHPPSFYICLWYRIWSRGIVYG